MEQARAAVIIAAAGIGARFGGELPKQFQPLCKKPLLARAIEPFEASGLIGEIIVAVPEGYADYTRKKIIGEYSFDKVTEIITGGATRGQTVRAALEAVGPGAEIILVHDGARPFVSETLIEDAIELASEGFAAIPGLRPNETVKAADDDGIIKQTLERDNLWFVQTPQAFPRRLLIDAHEMAFSDGFEATDDAKLVERMQAGIARMFVGEALNIKITCKDDLLYAEAICKLFDAENNFSQGKAGRDNHRAKRVDVYADGACLGNPGPGGYGSVLLFSDGSGRVYRKELSGGFAGTTNNRMEIVSVVAALDALREPCGVTVYSDSRYVVDSVEKGWLERWAKNGWAKSDKEPVLNRDLWQKLIPLIKKHDVEFVWIKGHGGNAENERCDFLARKAAASVESGDGG